MPDLSPDELAALNASFCEIRPAYGLRAALQNRGEFFFGLACGFAAGIISVLVAFDVWLYVWK